jgi:glutamate synthase domain-containing protein 2
MFSIGCIEAMRCIRNTCPTGVTTHDPRRRPEDYGISMRQEIERIPHACGMREPRDPGRHPLRLMRQGRRVPMDELHPCPAASPRAPTTA